MDDTIKRIAYLTTYKAESIEKWSGTGYFIHRALQGSGLNTVAVGGFRHRRWLTVVAKKLFYTKVCRRQYLVDRDPLVVQGYARQAERKISCHFDIALVFSPGSLPLAGLRTDKPIVFWTDATFAAMVDFYPAFSNLCAETIAGGHAAEQAALDRCALAIYSSSWAAESAISDYRTAPDKVAVVPFGANLTEEELPKDIEKLIASRQTLPLKLLFLGVDWQRKGGDLALATVRELRRQGMAAELHVAGCRPPHHVKEDWVRCHGFLDKKHPADRGRLAELMKAAHFLIMPSRAECFGLVFAEASAFALPSLAADVGGVSAAVLNGENGYLFSSAAGPEKYAETITELMMAPERYAELCRSSLAVHCNLLNWKTAGQKVKELLYERLA